MSRSFKKTIILKVDPVNPQKDLIRSASRIIRNGGLVAFPTETVYGLGANALDEGAIRELHKVKNRPEGKPFTIAIFSVRSMEKILDASAGGEAKKILDKFWPGPLTVILRSLTGERIGFRMPAGRIALEIIRTSDVPIALPSANISGNIAPSSADEVIKELDGKIDMIVDGGPTELRTESTVIDMTVSPLRVLRRGAVSEEELKKVYGEY